MTPTICKKKKKKEDVGLETYKKMTHVPSPHIVCPHVVCHML